MKIEYIITLRGGMHNDNNIIYYIIMFAKSKKKKRLNNGIGNRKYTEYTVDRQVDASKVSRDTFSVREFFYAGKKKNDRVKHIK